MDLGEAEAEGKVLRLWNSQRMTSKVRDDLADWDEWMQTCSSREEVQANPFRFGRDRSLRQQCLCFFLGMAIFLPGGLKIVSSVQSCEVFAAKQPTLRAREVAPVSAAIERAAPSKIGVLAKRKARRRFLALNTKAQLSLFPIESDGSVAPKPSDVLSLSSIQDPGLDDFFQGSQLIVHPHLNVLYECSLDATRMKLLIHSYSFNEKGKLTRLARGPFVFDVRGQHFRGGADGIVPCFDATGTYLYFTQESWGGATGQGPQIPYLRVDSQGAIDEQMMSVTLDLPADKFYSVSLEAGQAGSNDLYMYVTTPDSYHMRTAYHCKVLPNGSFAIDSQASSSEGVFQAQASERFLRESRVSWGCWRSWRGLRLDDQGRILEYYSWPAQEFFLQEVMPGYAIGLKHSVGETEARLFTLGLKDDRPTASSSKVTIARIHDLRKVVSDPQNQQVYLFSQSCEGTEMVRVALRDGRLRAFGPQKLDNDDFGSLSCGFGKVQILSL